MVQLGFALDMILLLVPAIISLELMALSLGLGSTGAPKMTQCTLNMQIFQLFIVLLGFDLDILLL